MNTTERLEATLNTSTSDTIVAIPGGLSHAQADPSIREFIAKSVMPIATSGLCFVYGHKAKFEQPEYKESFLEKCQALGTNVSFACI